MAIREAEEVRCALACLHVLERDVVDGLAAGEGVLDVLQHLLRGGADVDLGGGDAERAHQGMRVAAGPLAGGEAGHRIGEDVLPRQVEPVHRLCGDDECLRRVETARDADHDLLDPGRGQPLHEPVHLDVVGLEAALVAHERIGRDERESLDSPAERDVALERSQLEADAAEGASALGVIGRGVTEAGHSHAVLRQPLEVHVGDDELLLVREAPALGEQLAVLVDQGVTVPGEVRG